MITEYFTKEQWTAKVRDLRGLYPVAPDGDSNRWEHRFVQAMHRLPYLKSIVRNAGGEYDVQLAIKVTLKEGVGNLEAAQKDFKSLIGTHGVGQMDGFICYESGSEGFDLYLVVLDDEKSVFTATFQARTA